MINTDGSNQINLTNSPAHNWDPTWSPDGKKIAFTSNRDGNQEIYVMDVDESTQINSTNNPADDRCPAWCCYSLLKEEPLPVEYSFVVAIVVILLITILTIIFLKRRKADSL